MAPLNTIGELYHIEKVYYLHLNLHTVTAV